MFSWKNIENHSHLLGSKIIILLLHCAYRRGRNTTPHLLPHSVNTCSRLGNWHRMPGLQCRSPVWETETPLLSHRCRPGRTPVGEAGIGSRAMCQTQAPRGSTGFLSRAWTPGPNYHPALFSNNKSVKQLELQFQPENTRNHMNSL